MLSRIHFISGDDFMFGVRWRSQLCEYCEQRHRDLCVYLGWVGVAVEVS